MSDEPSALSDEDEEGVMDRGFGGVQPTGLVPTTAHPMMSPCDRSPLYLDINIEHGTWNV